MQRVLSIRDPVLDGVLVRRPKHGVPKNSVIQRCATLPPRARELTLRIATTGRRQFPSSAKSGPSPILAVTSAVIAPITRWESPLPHSVPPGSVSSSADSTPVGLWRSAMPDPTRTTLRPVPSRRSGHLGAFERRVSERLRSAQGLKIPVEGKVRRMRSATCHAAQPKGDQHARQPCLSSP